MTSALLGLLLLAPAAERPDTAALDAVLADALKRWQAPGLAVVVVRGDEVVYLKGAGVRRAGGADAVTPDTLFAVASLTKAFTATTLAALVDEAKAKWDDPVRRHLPWFRLADPLADRDVTLRDLLCHRTGLGRHDLLLYHAPWGPEESVRRMAALPAAAPFRARFEYSNLGYAAAGLALAEAAGEPWPDAMRRRLLTPLGMKGACFTRADVLKTADRAEPHRRDGNAAVPTEWPDDAVEAATGLKCSARDLAAWLRFQLGDGTFGGKRVVSAAALAETHAPQVVVPLEADRPRQLESTAMTYGLGWRLTDYRGHPLWEHNGNCDGFRARVLVLPKDRVAVAVLANADEYGVVHAVAHLLADRMLGLEARDWHGVFREWQRERDAEPRERAERFARTRRPGTHPSRELSAYAGTYVDAAYGEVVVAAGRDGLRLTWRRWAGPLKHFHYDTFATGADAGPLADAAAQFELRTDGEVGALRFLGRTFLRKEG